MADSYTQKPGIYPALPTVEPLRPDTRDPHGINKHLQLDFFHVIGEPDHSAYSFEALHSIFHKVYQYSKLFIYRLLTILLGIPLMLLWGLVFGAYAFLMIWIVSPMRRLSQSAIAEFGIYIQTVSDAVIAPLYRSMGQMWSNVNVTITRQPIDLAKQIQV